MYSVFHDLLDSEISKIRSLGVQAVLESGQPIFNEGDMADYLYFIESGRVTLYIDKFNSRVEIQQAVSGDWFGEVATYSNGHRTASAVTTEKSLFLKIAGSDFQALLKQEAGLASKLRDIINARNCALVLEEKMVNAGSAGEHDLHYSIKGDPSLRESAMERPRYESVVDRNLTELAACFEDMLLNRTVHRIMIGFNNGEIRVSTLLDPYADEFHPALRLLDSSYVDRHFPIIDYSYKISIIRDLYQAISGHSFFGKLPEHLRHGFTDYFDRWKAVTPAEISRICKLIPTLRIISNYYARNITINIVKDAIHIQFNCDGTHIVNIRNYERFVEENL